MNKKLLLLTAAFTAVSTLSFAQGKKPKLGLVFDDAEYDAAPRQSKFAGSKFAELPLKVSLRKYCPTPGDQGDLGTCVGWSTCYGALTTQYAIRNNLTDKTEITSHAYSGLFVYNLVKATEPVCDGGTRIPLAMTKLMSAGDCYHNDFITTSCYTKPSEDLKTKAKNNAIQDFMSLYGVLDDPKVKIMKTKQALAENKPVVIGMNLMENFMDISNADPYWRTNKGDQTYCGGHAMCVVGYDEGKEAFEILNSWGADWGDEGFCWVKYDDFGKNCKYGFTMLLKPESATPTNGGVTPATPVTTKMGGDFTFRYLKDRATLTFEPVVPNLIVNGYYTLPKRDWKVGELFQLVAKNAHADEYVYVFSIDSKKEAHIHFPRTAVLAPEYEGFNETPLVPIANAEIIIPTPESALTIAQAGTDNLIVLFSRTKITDVKEIIAKLKLVPSIMVYTELKKALGTRLVKAADVKYETNKMSFTSTAPADAIVPLVLAVESK